VHPLAVSGIGGKYFYRDEREVEDHVFVTFEFPGRNYYAGDAGETVKDRQKRGEIQDKNDKVIVTYSSINTSGFEPYGECVMGSNGSMVVEKEESVMIYPERGGRSTSVSVATTPAGQPTLDTTASGTGPASAQSVGQAA